MNIQQFERGINELRTIDSEMQAQTITILLLVFTRPGIAMREIEQRTGYASSTVSRNVAALGQVHRKGMPGHNLIVAREDPMDRRTKRVYPTAKGQHFFAVFKEAIGDKGE